MPPVYDLAIIALAAGRIAYAVSLDEIFRPVREWVYWRSAPEDATDRDGSPWRALHRFRSTQEELERWPTIGKWQVELDPSDPRKPGFFGQLIECVYCTSAWISLAAMLAYVAAPDATVVLLTPFAVWAAANAYAKWLS